MNFLKTLSLIGLVAAVAAAPVDSSSDKLLASIKRASKQFESVHARTSVDTRDFEDFVQGAEQTGEDIKNFFSGDKRDWIDDASNFFDNVGDAFSGGDDKQKRDWIDDIQQFGEDVKDTFSGDSN